MIINTGARTDIPAFYSEWFMNRIKDGFVYVRNPFNRNQVTKYILDSEVVDCLEFCTKNPYNMLKYLDKLDKFNQYWFVTITPYKTDVEREVERQENVIESFKKLSNYLGTNCVGWRYDPIFIGKGFDVDRHIKEFEKIATKLKGYTHDCTISFIDLFRKVKRNIANVSPPTKEETILIAKAFSKIASENDMIVHSCCEGAYLSEYGIDVSGCASKEIIERAIGYKLNPPKRKNIRQECNCLLGNDIGAYNTCGHFCTYCYANSSQNIVKENMKNHIKTSPFLIGNLEINDKISIAKQESWKIENEQITFDLG